MSTENPTNAELVSSVVGAVEVVQDAQAQPVEGVKKISTYNEIKSNVDSAKASGQIGNPVYLGDVDFNTVLETGSYGVACESGQIKNQPTNSGVVSLLTVNNINGFIYQEFSNPFEKFIRRSGGITNTPITWSGWNCVFCSKGNITIYISKNGNDAYLGISPDYPVLTVSRAIEVANSIIFGVSNAYVAFNFGAGDWGDILFESLPYTIYIQPYDNTTHVEYSDELPEQEAQSS